LFDLWAFWILPEVHRRRDLDQHDVRLVSDPLRVPGSQTPSWSGDPVLKRKTGLDGGQNIVYTIPAKKIPPK
jgi:hypothetical protein